jgi:hypothetical protein
VTKNRPPALDRLLIGGGAIGASAGWFVRRPELAVLCGFGKDSSTGHELETDFSSYHRLGVPNSALDIETLLVISTTALFYTFGVALHCRPLWRGSRTSRSILLATSLSVAGMLVCSFSATIMLDVMPAALVLLWALESLAERHCALTG